MTNQLKIEDRQGLDLMGFVCHAYLVGVLERIILLQLDLYFWFLQVLFCFVLFFLKIKYHFALSQNFCMVLLQKYWASILSVA